MQVHIVNSNSWPSNCQCSLFKEKFNYVDFLHFQMAWPPIYSGKVEFYCIKIMKYWIIILLIVFYGCETWSFTLRGRRYLGWGCLRIGCWRRYLSLRGDGEDYITRSFMISTPHQILFVWSYQEEWEEWGMRQIQETERCTQGRPDGKIPHGRPRHS